MRSKGKIQYILVIYFLTAFPAAALTEALADEVVRALVFFGLSIPDGQSVSLMEWQNFVKDEIVPRFDGFNIVDSVGFWKGKTERSKIVTFIITKKNAKEKMRMIRLIAQSYAKKFKQDSVVVIDIAGNREFVIRKQE